MLGVTGVGYILVREVALHLFHRLFKTFDFKLNRYRNLSYNTAFILCCFYTFKVKLLDDTLSIVDMECKLKGDEKRVGDFDCIWDDGPVAPIVSNFLVDLRTNLAAATNQASSTMIQMNPNIKLTKGPGKRTRKTVAVWLPLPPLNSFLGCLQKHQNYAK